jgi:hypothetical protein
MEVTTMTRLTISIFFVAISLMFVGQSYAKIDLQTMVGAWTLDEGSGKIAKDSSIYENDGTLISSPDWVNGHFGKALSFDGKTDYIDCGNAASLNLTKSLTVMGWVNPDKALGLDNWQRFAARGEYNTGWMIGITNVGKPDLTVTNAGGGFVTMYGKTTTELGKWYHIAGVVDSNAKKVYIYLNGTLDNDPKAHSGEMMNPNVSTVIGKSGVAHVYDFHGIIDEVAIFNVALTEDDIKNLMNEGIGPTAVSSSGKLAITWVKIKAK